MYKINSKALLWIPRFSNQREGPAKITAKRPIQLVRRTTIICSGSNRNIPPSGRDNRLTAKNNTFPSIGAPSSSALIPSFPPSEDDARHPGFQTLDLLTPLCKSTSDFIGRTLYKYYNWRQDTLSDLQLFMVINTLVIALGAILRRTIADPNARMPDLSTTVEQQDIATSWWQDLYSVLVVVLGQQLPEGSSVNVSEQIFAVGTAVLGLASFALVLALIEQATLELLETNVRKGSRVYETGHFVVIAFGESARDLSQVATIVRQLCAASTPHSSGAVIVVLIEKREKLEMETLFQETLPQSLRGNCQVVFRQGSPLDPGALNLVGVADARAVIITGDYSSSIEDSDAQVLRCAVLIDEATAAAGKEWVSEKLPLASGADSRQSALAGMGPWVIAEVQGRNVPGLLRYACTDRVLTVPSSTIHARRYARLLLHSAVATLSHALFDHTSAANSYIGYYEDAEYLLGKRFDELQAYFPSTIVAGIVDLKTGLCSHAPPPDRTLNKCEGIVMLRGAVDETPLRPLLTPISGFDPGTSWNPETYHLRSMDDAPLGKNADATIRTCWLPSNHNNVDKGGVDAVYPATRPPLPKAPLPHVGGLHNNNSLSFMTSNDDITTRASPGRKSRPMKSKNPRLDAALVPLSFRSNPGIMGGTELLICGWSGPAAMWELLRELDHGVEALPEGSRVILLNPHNKGEIWKKCAMDGLKRLQIRHIQCDPRDRRALSEALDVTTLRAAIILQDIKWSGREAGEESPYAHSLSDMLRIDAALLEVQLNVRYLLEEACCPDINIICEKLTYLGQTRFEDRVVLPVGTAVNSASFVAKVLAQTAVQPRSLASYAQVGIQTDILVQDSSAFAQVNEELTFLSLQARCSSVNQVLLGFYDLPDTLDEVVNIVVNPEPELRVLPRVWNNGSARCKLITLAPKRKMDGGRAVGRGSTVMYEGVDTDTNNTQSRATSQI